MSTERQRLDELAQAAALAVKKEREGEYPGAYQIAQDIVDQTDEVREHWKRIMFIREEVEDTVGLFSNLLQEEEE